MRNLLLLLLLLVGLGVAGTLWGSTAIFLFPLESVAHQVFIAFVLAGMGRYLYLVYHEGRGGRPHEILLNDFALQVIVIGWVGAAIYIIGV